MQRPFPLENGALGADGAVELVFNLQQRRRQLQIATARIAGIMAAKQTANLIPLCHPLPLHQVEVHLTANDDLPGFCIQSRVKTLGETGVEMEALTAVTIAALTLYDMAKALEKSITIEHIHLVRKTGGKSGDWVASA